MKPSSSHPLSLSSPSTVYRDRSNKHCGMATYYTRIKGSYCILFCKHTSQAYLPLLKDHLWLPLALWLNSGLSEVMTFLSPQTAQSLSHQLASAGAPILGVPLLAALHPENLPHVQ
jgi:hypothetical protein